VGSTRGFIHQAAVGMHESPRGSALNRHTCAHTLGPIPSPPEKVVGSWLEERSETKPSSLSHPPLAGTGDASFLFTYAIILI
jgi:hypothetical protein